MSKLSLLKQDLGLVHSNEDLDVFSDKYVAYIKENAPTHLQHLIDAVTPVVTPASHYDAPMDAIVTEVNGETINGTHVADMHTFSPNFEVRSKVLFYVGENAPTLTVKTGEVYKPIS